MGGVRPRYLSYRSCRSGGDRSGSGGRSSRDSPPPGYSHFSRFPRPRDFPGLDSDEEEAQLELEAASSVPDEELEDDFGEDLSEHPAGIHGHGPGRGGGGGKLTH